MRLGQKQRTVNFNVQQIDPTEEGGYTWRWQSVTLPPGVWAYGPIVDAIVTERYPAADMQAVVNNYLADPSKPDTAGEFNAMQDWRTFAKEVAKEALNVL